MHQLDPKHEPRPHAFADDSSPGALQAQARPPGQRASHLRAVQRQAARPLPPSLSSEELLAGQGPRQPSPSEQAFGTVQLQVVPAAPAPHPFEKKIAEYQAKRDALRQAWTVKTDTPFEMMTSVVGMYTNEPFNLWHVWRTEMMQIGEEAWSFKEQIFTEVAASSLDPGKPEDQKIIEQALAVAESCRFIWIDATDSAVPRMTHVTVIERVEDVTFTVTMKVQERKSDSALDIYLDRIKSEYEAASKKTEGK